MRTSYVTVLPYSDQWERDFLKIKDEIKSALGELAESIEHVGNTSVRGLSAKPVIDIDVVISDSSVLSDVIAALGRIGYQHEGDLGITGRKAFRYDGKDHLQKHHLYVCTEDSPELRRHIAFRDYLRSHPEAAAEYSRIKEEGAALYPEDIDRYIEYKTPFIEKIYREIGV
ncbi:MAG: GrpB family protein [Oscillospiraceae bacterium]|nr:GrpB family protein [Oscillospiraceae bacterium]